MLIEFRTKNYKSFNEELIFSMVPAPKQKGLDYSILIEKIGSKVYKALCSSVIYGPNASGKTNLIGAMEVLKSIVLRGNVKNANEYLSPNIALSKLELIPNAKNKNNKPTMFFINFFENNILFEFKLIIDLGGFLDKNYKRKIIYEHLSVNEKVVFSRNKNELQFGELSFVEKFGILGFDENKSSVISLAKENLQEEELFLTSGFKVMFSSIIVNMITSWFKNKFIIVYRADMLETHKDITKPKKNMIYKDDFNEAARIFGSSFSDVGYIVEDEEAEPTRVSIVGNRAILTDLFESYGTIRFMNMFPLLVSALKNGGTLVIDEFDASIHPMALMNIVNIFHNDEVNVNKAQLIFNTHNPIFLNRNLFRRDEIKFVERDDFTHNSTLYSLSDFGTSGKSGARKQSDYMKNYFISQYGAIKEVDFTPIFEKILKEAESTSYEKEEE